MIIDFHTHCFPDKIASRAVSTLAEKANGITAYTDGTIQDLKRSMNHAEITLSVLQPIATKPEQTVGVNQWAIDVQDEQIISFGTIHPDYPQWQDEIKRLNSAGIKGVKFHPDYQSFFVDEPRLFPIYEALFQTDMIALFHAGVDIGIPDVGHCTPQRFRNLIDAFPKALIVAAHMGGYQYWDEVEQYLVGSSIYLDTSYSFTDLGSAPMKRLIQAHGADRILFATDSPWTDQSVEVTNIRTLGLTTK